MFVQKNEVIYLSTTEMLADLGYKTVTPTIGSLGKALMEASKENPSCEWLKHQQDVMFRKMRRENKKHNGRKK